MIYWIIYGNSIGERDKSYQDTILELMDIAEKRKKEQDELLIEGYKEMAEESLKICNEFRYADAELDRKFNNDN